jgi:error-prone DNA polymerase
VLRDTLGTIIFQDQVIEVAMAFAGFSPGEAEGLRRAMSRKRSAAAIEAYHQRFVDGAIAKQGDVDAPLAERVWTMIVGFSGFGFPKAHGAAFGLLAYQSTWLRVHYGPEFLCALLDEQPMGFYPPDALIHEGQRRGIEILPPDVNASEVGCTVTAAGAVRLGLGYVLGVRADEVEALVAARDADGPFGSLDDLASRAGACRSTLDRLAWSGACDSLAGRSARASRAEGIAAGTGGGEDGAPIASEVVGIAVTGRAARVVEIASAAERVEDGAAAASSAVEVAAAAGRAEERAAGAGRTVANAGPACRDLHVAVASGRVAADGGRVRRGGEDGRGEGPESIPRPADGAARGLPSSARRTALWRLGIAAPAYGTGDDGTQMALPLDLPEAPDLAPMAEWDAMIADYATTGLTVDRHPLRLLRPGLEARGTVRSADLARLRHGASVSIGGLVVARQRPGTANGVVFLLIEDETGTVNLIVPPRIYERDRLTVRTEPLVLVDGTLERHASAGGAINVLVQRLTPLDAADLRTERPAATVKDFSPLDERERQRILEEQPLVAVAGAGGATAGGGSPTGRRGALAAVAARSSESNGRAGPPGREADGAVGPNAGSRRTPVAAGSATPEHPSGGADTGAGRLAVRATELSSGDSEPNDPTVSDDVDRRLPERPVREHGGAEDFRAVAPPVMSFTQGRRR